MTNVAIRADNLSKQYRIGRARAQHDTLRDALMAAVRRPLARLRGGGQCLDEEEDTIWALRDVSFEVDHGEVLGIIGPNGAGKSTLLKILSRITEPTEGRAVINGRVGSLLEVGTGFHPELTGRENVYLNGAILGMTRAEIHRKFDEIVAFAEIERFLDTPVKRYSSGMYVRLAFAVAAHLEPEILLVDEVLAVGDASFQEKCLGKMGDVAYEGRTVLFVSHNMVAVQSLCDRAIWLDSGRIVQEGRPVQVVSSYLGSTFSASATEEVWEDIAKAPGNGNVRLRRVCVRPADSAVSDQITMHTPVLVEIEYWNLVPDSRVHVELHFYTEQQIVAFTSGPDRAPTWQDKPLPRGLFRSVCRVPGDLLNSGTHRVVVLVVTDGRVTYRHEDALSFDVLDLAERHAGWYGREPGVMQPALDWVTEYLEDPE